MTSLRCELITSCAGCTFGNHIARDPPSPLEGLSIGSQLILADGGKRFLKDYKLCLTGETGVTAARPICFSESNDPGMVQAFRALSLPKFVKQIWAWYLRHIRGDETYATLVEGWHRKTVPEYLALVAKREEYRVRWHKYLNDEKLDFILCVPNALPAQRHGQIKEGWKACNYTFLFNIVSYLEILFQ